jgi:hypothetical protein
MHNRSSKRPRDVNSLAKMLVDIATGNAPAEVSAKDPAAVALGRKGGLKGGRARAEVLTSKRRQQIAVAAAKARWGKKNEGNKS